MISHFHPDHILGLKRKDGSPTFRTRKCWVPEAEWRFWMDDGRIANPPDALKANLAAVQKPSGAASRSIAMPGTRRCCRASPALGTPGHTPGHTSFRLESGGKRLLIASDITNHPALFVRHPDWSALFDMDADQARATRHRMLALMAEERLPVAFYHAPFPAAGHIAKAGGAYEFVPLQWGGISPESVRPAGRNAAPACYASPAAAGDGPAAVGVEGGAAGLDDFGGRDTPHGAALQPDRLHREPDARRPPGGRAPDAALRPRPRPRRRTWWWA